MRPRQLVFELDGKPIVYDCETVFAVSVGKGKRGSYKVRHVFTGQVGRAFMYYNMINIGNGYKKRITMIKDKRIRVLARESS